MNKILILLIFASLNTHAKDLWCGNDSRLKPSKAVESSQFGKPPAQPLTKEQMKARDKRLKEQKEARAVADAENTPVKETENQTIND